MRRGAGRGAAARMEVKPRDAPPPHIAGDQVRQVAGMGQWRPIWAGRA
jgi:hypothetical protein